jgi:hypothetical protein
MRFDLLRIHGQGGENPTQGQTEARPEHLTEHLPARQQIGSRFSHLFLNSYSENGGLRAISG